MGMEEKPMPRSLMTPGREDLSPWPPVGQLEFERIINMNEGEVERAFRERHGLNGVFKRSQKTQSFPYSRDSERRLELKKMTLARLEGFPMSRSSVIWEWYDTRSGEESEPEMNLRSTLFRILTDECKQRITQVEESVAREAAINAPSDALKKVEHDIQTALRQHGLPPMSASEIINPEYIPHHRGGSFGGSWFTVEQLLKLFLLQIQGLSESESAQRMGTSVKSLEHLKSERFSEEAKAAIRTVRGHKVLK
jgi:hypothetical protein